MVEKSVAQPRPRGRPRRFDPDAVLDAAVDALWRNGPQGVSLNELSRALGVAKPALAAAYGGKDALVALALGRYYARTVAVAEAAIATAATPAAVAERYIGAFLTMLGERESDAPVGCLLLAATEASACEPEGPIREAVETLQKRQFGALRDRLAAVGAADPVGQARFILGQTMALALMSRGGADRRALEDFARRAVAASAA
jgi:AcrR family transcriptional regulator